MKFRSLTKLCVQVFFLIACAAGSASAAPLILAQPTSKIAFLGDTNATFQVLATGSPAPTYQWQVKSAVPPDSIFADVPGATGANLSLPNPSPGVDGNQYRCVVTSGTSVQSAAATLKVYPSPIMSPPAATVSPDTVASDSSANITIQVTSLPFPGSTVRIERILDINANGIADIGEPVVQSFLVTDGQATWLGSGSNVNSLNTGVRNQNIPGDDDTGMMSMNGIITTHISLPASPESGRTAGNYLIRISDPSSMGMFKPITRPLAVTQPTLGQSVSGQVTSGSSPVPYAVVTALESGDDNHFVASTVADASGNYTLALPAGSHTLMTSNLGYVAAMPTAPSFSLNASQVLTGQNPVMVAATCTITGTVHDGATPLMGVQLYAESSDGSVALTSSDSAGNYVLPAIPGQWTIHTSQSSLAALGYLDLDDGFRATPTEGGTATLDIPLTAATAMVYGTARNPQGIPMPGVQVEAGDDPYEDETDYQQQYDWTTFTDAEGKYFIGVSSGVEWRIMVDTQPAIAPHVMPPHEWVTTASGAATQLDFAVQAVTAHITGTVTKDSAPLAGIVVWVSSDTNDVELTATTDASGNFDLGVVADTWWIGLDDESLIYAFRPPVTISNGQTVGNQNITVLESSGTISGFVVDPFGNNPSTDEDVYAYTESGPYFEVSVQPNPDGSFSLPVLAGVEWWVGADGCGDDQSVTPQPDASVTIIQSAINEGPNDQSVPLGGNATFSVQVDAPSPTIQWQRLPSGADWDTGGIHIMDDTTYSGASTDTLTVTSTTPEMSGDEFRCVVTYTFNETTTITNTSDEAELVVVTAHLRGTVTKNGQPVAGVRIGAGNGHQWYGDNYTDANGNFDIGISGNGNWYISVDSGYAASHNLVGPNLQVPVADNEDVNNISILLADGTGTISGQVVDADGNPVSDTGVWANASIGGNSYWGYWNTDDNGNYRFPVIDGTWNVGVNGPLNFTQQTVAVSGSAVVNFAPAQIVAHLQGTVTKNGTAALGILVTAWQNSGSGGTSVTTDANGNFDFSLTATGTWNIGLENNFGISHNLVGARLTNTVTNNQTISGIVLPIADATGMISGNVRDSGGNALAQAGIYANATINGFLFFADARTDASGNYSLPVIDGTWTVGVNGPLVFTQQTVAVSGSSVVNFPAAPFASWQGTKFTPDDVATGLTTLTADFDRDGLPNLLEYAFRKNPKVPDAAGIVPDVSANKMQISFPCDAGATDITYTVQASSNLSAWEDIAESIGGAVTVQKNSSGCTISDTGTGLRTVTVTEATAITGRRFLRVKVTSL